MRLRPSCLALVSGLVLPLALVTASFAENAPPAPPSAPPGEAAGPHHHFDPAERRAHMAEHLTAVLQLQPSQQGALDAFLASMKRPGDAQGRREQRHDDMAQLSTPERLDRMMAHFDAMHARMTAHVQATKQFYAQLSPSQQKAFDALAPMMGHGGGHMGGPGMGHGMVDHGGPGAEHEMGPDTPPQG